VVGLDPRRRLLDDPAAVIQRHTADATGACAVCTSPAQTVVAPCTIARQSLAVLETHGVSRWDEVEICASAAPGSGIIDMAGRNEGWCCGSDDLYELYRTGLEVRHVSGRGLVG
jgi:hypothetical protein